MYGCLARWLLLCVPAAAPPAVEYDMVGSSFKNSDIYGMRVFGAVVWKREKKSACWRFQSECAECGKSGRVFE